MLSKRHEILDICEQGLIKPEDIQQAMTKANVFPDRKKWYRFIERVLLWIGIISLVSGVVFFVAYNWSELGRIGKFALLESLIAVSVLPLIWLRIEKISGKIVLFGASIILGALLALFGQIYQTGADTWQLFATWAVLIVPWVWIGRFEPLWIVWIVLVNVAIILYFSLFGLFDILTFSIETFLGVVLLFVNAVFLGAWEYLHNKNNDNARTYIRFPALFTIASATWVGSVGIVDNRIGEFMMLMIWIVSIAAVCLIYRYKIKDLFMLTLGCLSVIVVLITFLVKHFIGNIFNDEGLFFIAFAIILAGSLSGLWLKNTAASWEELHA